MNTGQLLHPHMWQVQDQCVANEIQNVLQGTCTDAMLRATEGVLTFVTLPADKPHGTAQVTHFAQAGPQHRSPRKRNNTVGDSWRETGPTQALQNSCCKDGWCCHTLVPSCSPTVHSYISATLGNFPCTRKNKKSIYDFSSLLWDTLRIVPNSTRWTACWCDRLQGPAVRLLISQQLSTSSRKERCKSHSQHELYCIPFTFPTIMREMVTFIA